MRPATEEALDGAFALPDARVFRPAWLGEAANYSRWTALAKALVHISQQKKDVERQETLRVLAVALQLRPHHAKSEDDAGRIRGVIVEWLDLLLDEDAATRSSFLQEFRASKDVALYTDGRPIKGLRLSDLVGDLARRAPGAGVAGDETQAGRLLDWKWLRTGRLTVAELELALTIFDWHETEPRLVWWLRSPSPGAGMGAECPYILWRIHAFLLRRYCFALLGPLRRAQSEAGLMKPQYRAGPQFFPRIAGYAAIGYLAVLGLDFTVPLAFAGSTALVLPLTAAGVLALAAVFNIDLQKQNIGLSTGWRHMLPRTVSLMLRSMAYSLSLAAIFMVVSGLSLALTPNIFVFVGPEIADPAQSPVLPSVAFGLDPDWRRVLAIIALATWASLTGAIIQWFWEDRSFIEPV